MPSSHKCSEPLCSCQHTSAPTWKIWFDGATYKSNPSKRGGAGWVVIGPRGTKRSGERGYMHSNSTTTNNEMEYEALRLALRDVALKVRKKDNVMVFGDSKLVVEQINKRWNVKSESLKPFYKKCRRELRKLRKMCNQVNVVHVRRDLNTEADALSKRALQLPTMFLITKDAPDDGEGHIP